MWLIDLVIYIALIILFLFCLWVESKHYVCDVGNCDFLNWARTRSSNDRDEQIMRLHLQTRHGLWMKCFILAFVITLFVYWWFTCSVPPAIYFVVVLLVIFIILYFGYAFYQHHFLAPVNLDLADYIRENCSLQDQRRDQVDLG